LNALLKNFFILTVVICLFFLVTSCSTTKSANLTNTTSQVSLNLKIKASVIGNLKSPLSRESCVTQANNQVILAGGVNEYDQSTNLIFSFNPLNLNFSTLGYLKLPTHDAAAGYFPNNVFVYGGGSFSIYNTIEQLNLLNGRVTIAGVLNQPRADLTSIKVNNYLYLIGGYNQNAYQAQILVSSNGTSFSQVGLLPVPVRYGAVAYSKGLIYVFGGIGISGAQVNVIQAFDIKSGTTKVIGYLPVPLSGAYAGSFNNTVFLTGGITQNSANQIIWELKNNKLVPQSNLPTQSAYGCMAQMGSSFYIFGGENFYGKPLNNIIKINFS
jgi:N-acetylneuraminic acid mutarotase